MNIKISTPDIPVDGAQVVRFQVIGDAGTAVIPASVSVSIADGDGMVVSAGAASVALAGECSYSVIPALPLGWGYMVTASVTIDGATVTPAPGVIDVVPYVLVPEITDADMLAYEPMLTTFLPAGSSDYSAVRSAAWEQIRAEMRQRAMADGGRGYGYPTDAGQLRLPHLFAALATALAPLSTDPADAFASRAEKYRERSSAALGRVQIRYRPGVGSGGDSGWTVVGVG